MTDGAPSTQVQAMTVDVKALRELLAKATPGPWKAGAPVSRRDDYGESFGPHCDIEAPSDTVVLWDGWTNPADAALIAALVNAAPELLDRLELLQRENDGLSDAVGGIQAETVRAMADLEAKLAAAEERAALAERYQEAMADKVADRNKQIAELEARPTTRLLLDARKRIAELEAEVARLSPKKCIWCRELGACSCREKP